MKLVSVIIPCFDQAEYLSQAINSVLNQTYKHYEIIVVDDCSPDNTDAIARLYPVNYIRHLQNRGLPTSRNNGIKIAKGERILCLDSSDTIEPTMLEKCVDIEGVAVVGVHNFGDREEAWVLPYNDLSLEAFKQQNRITCCSMFDKKDWEMVGGFDENMRYGKEDYDFWLSLLEKGVKFTAVNDYLFNYRAHGIGMAQQADMMEKEILKYTHNKHKDLWPNP